MKFRIIINNFIGFKHLQQKNTPLIANLYKILSLSLDRGGA
mgnify:CR=1 FL=1